MNHKIIHGGIQRQNAKGQVELRVLNADGSIDRVVKGNNLILNQGLNNIAASTWCTQFEYCAIGTGTTPTQDSGGVTTAAQSGTTVTLSGGSFTFTDTGTDAGKIIRWAGGATARIVTVASGTSATVANSATVGAATFTVYRTNQVGLATETDRINDFITGSGNCGTTVAAGVVTHKRTWLFPAEVGSITYTEAGFSDTGSAGNNLFSRILLAVPVSLVATQQLVVVYTLTLTISPATPAAKTADILGWPVAPATDTDGDEQIQLYGLSAVDVSTGTTTSIDAANLVNEPSEDSNAARIFLSTTTSALATIGTATNRTGTSPAQKATSLTSYTALSFTLDKVVTFDTSEANATTWRSLGIGYSSTSYVNNAYVFLFDQAQTKDVVHTLELHITYAWDRDFS